MPNTCIKVSDKLSDPILKLRVEFDIVVRKGVSASRGCIVDVNLKPNACTREDQIRVVDNGINECRFRFLSNPHSFPRLGRSCTRTNRYCLKSDLEMDNAKSANKYEIAVVAGPSSIQKVGLEESLCQRTHDPVGTTNSISW